VFKNSLTHCISPLAEIHAKYSSLKTVPLLYKRKLGINREKKVQKMMCRTISVQHLSVSTYTEENTVIK